MTQVGSTQGQHQQVGGSVLPHGLFSACCPAACAMQAMPKRYWCDDQQKVAPKHQAWILVG